MLREGNEPELPAIIAVAHENPVPLSKNQEHIWHMEQLCPETHIFNMPFVYELNGSLDIDALENAFQEILARHEALRTTFGEVAGRPMQLIQQERPEPITILDLRERSADVASKQAAEEILTERSIGFNLATGPVIRTKLLRLTDYNALLLVTVHHIVADEWSMEIFCEELASLYEKFLQRDSPLQLPKPRVQFADYAFWENRMLDTRLFDQRLQSWRAQLSGLRSDGDRNERYRRKRLTFRFGSRQIAFAAETFRTLNCSTKCYTPRLVNCCIEFSAIFVR
jgi:hypothetical protein